MSTTQLPKIPAPARFVALLLWGTLPLIAALGVNLWAREPYQFFPFVWLVGFFLWWQRVRAVGSVPEVRNPAAMICWGGALLLLITALILWSPWLGGLSFVGFLAGWSFRQQGRLAWKYSLPVLLLFLATLPPPLRLDETLLLRLKEIAVTLSSRFLDLRDVVHARSGSILELPGESLMVEEACSGINSFLSVMVAALFIVIFERRSWWHSIIVLGFTGGLVIAANVFRIVAATILKVERGIDLLKGSAHEWTGLAVFILAVLAVWSFDRLVAFFSTSQAVIVSKAFSGLASPAKAAREAAPSGEPESVGPWTSAPRTVTFCLIFAGFAGLVRGGLHYWPPAKSGPGSSTTTELPASLKFELPSEIQGWVQTQSASEEKNPEVEGMQSAKWYFSKGALLVSVAIDYPFTDYHDVSGCYMSAGWKPESASPFRAFGGSNLPASRLRFTRAPLMRAEVLSSNFISPANWVDPVKERERQKPASLFTGKFWGAETGPAPAQYRVQALWSGITPLLPGDREAIDLLFDEIRQKLAQQTLSAPPAPSS